MFKWQDPKQFAPPGYLTVAQYAKKHNVTRGHIYLKIRLGQIPKENVKEIEVTDKIIFVRE